MGLKDLFRSKPPEKIDLNWRPAKSSPAPADTPEEVVIQDLSPKVVAPEGFPYNFVLALHRADKQSIKTIASNEFTDNENLLIDGMELAWRGEYDALRQLYIASTQCSGVNVGWARLTMAEYYLNQGAIGFADAELSMARIVTSNLEQRELLDHLIEINAAKIDIARGKYKEAYQSLDNLIKSINDPYIRAIVFLILSQPARNTQIITSQDVVTLLEQAKATFQECRDPYYFALTELELSSNISDIKQALRKAQFALDELTILGRKHDCEVAINRVNELKAIKSGHPSARPKIQRYGNCLFISEPMQKILERINILADSVRSVFLTGDSGVGKSVIAQAIHYHKDSPRKDGSFVRASCADIPETMFEAEFFGYEPGAFTGGKKEGHKGLFYQADNGTLFLDEIGDLLPSCQPKLLAVLDSQEYRPLGAKKPVKCNVRIIAATNRDIDPIEGGGNGFRFELYSRISNYILEIPSLSERKSEIIPLSEEFLIRHCKNNPGYQYTFSADAKIFLESANYPANVRDLENLVIGGMDVARYEARKQDQTAGALVITASMLHLADKYTSVRRRQRPSSSEKGDDVINTIPEEVLEQLTSLPSDQLDFEDILKKVERYMVIQALTKCRGSIRLAAEYLKLDYHKLRRKIQEYQLTDFKVPHN